MSSPTTLRAKRLRWQRAWRARRRAEDQVLPAPESAPVPISHPRHCARCGCRLSMYHDPDSDRCYPCQRRTVGGK